MSHEIDMTTGAPAIAYVGEVPWHGLGHQMRPGAPIEEWQAKAGLLYDVEFAEVAYRPGKLGTEWRSAPRKKALYRADTGGMFEVVGDGYKPVQPRQILEFFRDLVDQLGFQIEVAGALKGGAIVWCLASNSHPIKIGGIDLIKPYLLASTSYNRSQATRIGGTTVRVVCNNTMQLSYRRDLDFISVPHSTEFDDEHMQRVKEYLGLFEQTVASYEDDMNRLADTPVDIDTQIQILRDLVGKVDKVGQPTPHSENVIASINDLIAGGPGANLKTCRGTAFGVLQGITRHVDFATRAANRDNRLTSSWFGQGNDVKGRALDALLELAA